MYVTGTWLLSHKLRIQEVFSGVVISRSKDPTVIVNGVYDRIMHRDSWIQDIRIMQERRTYRVGQQTPLSVVAEVLSEHGASGGRIGVDMTLLPAKSVDELRALIPDATLVEADDVFERARAIKTADEIAALQRAAVATEKAIRDALRMQEWATLKRKWQTTSSSASWEPERSIPGWFSTPVPTLELSTTSQGTRS